MRLSHAMLLVAAAAAFGAQGASAQVAPQPPNGEPQQKWQRLPSGADVNAIYPPAAESRGISGAVLMGCNVEPDGNMSRCKAFAETPEGVGFGAALVKLSSKFQLTKESVEHALPVPGRVFINVLFKTDGSAPKPYFIVGSHAVLLSAGPLQHDGSPEAGMGCFNSARDKDCKYHPFSWGSAPRVATSMTSILKAGKTQGVDVAVCAVAPDQTLTGCTVSGNEAIGVMTDLVASFRTPARADDGTPIASGPVAIVFDWEMLASAAKALLPDPAPVGGG